MQRSSSSLFVSPSSDLWVWNERQGNRWLSCQLLDPWPHGFWTRHGHPHKPDQLAGYLELSGDQAAWAHQIHSNDLVWSTSVLSALPDLQSRPQADAILSQRQGDSVWVCTADCVPILWACSQPNVVAAIHAGWRGTAASISTRVMATLAAQDLDLDQVRIAIGPAISGEAYQVSWQVAEQVLQTLPAHCHEEVLRPDPNPDRVRLDLKQVNRLQLRQWGLAEEQISVSPHCTRDQPEQFFSYRRAQGNLRDAQGQPQVQWSGIGIASWERTTEGSD